MMTILPRQEFPLPRQQKRDEMRLIAECLEVLVGQGNSSNQILSGGLLALARSVLVES
jgi:hypothetical protein